jgi:tetratricopeptide (TPR) repeat protein
MISSPLSPSSRNNPWITVSICLGLILAVWAVFGQTRHHEFINYDDNEYVIENFTVLGGLTWSGTAAAFTKAHASNWNPLSWLSHMLDVELYGLWPGGHHLTSVLFHALNAVLLFRLLHQLAGSLWPSCFAAAFFAVHPLRVESVAWIAERKDVLSGFFFLLTLLAYVRYARRPWSPWRYGLVLFLFACGLMAKPMLVTLPLILLLLDYWPLHRLVPTTSEPAFRWKSFALSRKVLLEKIPLFVLGLTFSLITLAAQENALSSWESLPLSLRLQNAATAYMIYLQQTAYPAGLAVFYPYPAAGISLGKVAISMLAIMALSFGSWHLRRRHPYVLIGWLWYLIMLVPVIGIIQVGIHAHTDHHTYLPQIGLAIALAWLLADWASARHRWQWIFSAGAGVALALLGFVAWRQTSHWKDSESLWTHALAHTSNNSLAHSKLSLALAHKGRWEEALHHGRQALALDPTLPDVHYNMAQVFLRKGDSDEAIRHFRKTLEIAPAYVAAYNNLAVLCAQKGQWQEMLHHFQKALEINPRYAEVHNNLCVILTQAGQTEQALEQGKKALEINPNYAEAHYNLGNAFQATGQLDEAITHYKKALAFRPAYTEALNNLAIACARAGRNQDAELYFLRFLEMNPHSVDAHYNLGQFLENTGNLKRALFHYQQAIQADPGHDNARHRLNDLLKQNEKKKK